MDRLPESTENYLETILILSQTGKPVRSIDIANALNFSKPSISVAMRNLRANKYITTNAKGHMHLTEKGREIAQKTYDRHTLLSEWLMFLGVDKVTAVNDACKMEHGMSEDSYIAIQRHINEWKREKNL